MSEPKSSNFNRKETVEGFKLRKYKDKSEP